MRENIYPIGGHLIGEALCGRLLHLRNPATSQRFASDAFQHTHPFSSTPPPPPHSITLPWGAMSRIGNANEGYGALGDVRVEVVSIVLCVQLRDSLHYN